MVGTRATLATTSVPHPSAWAAYERSMWARGLDYYRRRLRGLNLSGEHLLDLGCGPGQWAAAAAAEGLGVTACDRKIVPATTLGAAIHLVSAEATQLPFKDRSYDIVLCNLVLPYVSVEACVGEARRVLRVGGTFFGICHGPGYYLMQALHGLGQGPKATARRLGVVAYTLAHHALGLRRYYFETFQSPNQFAGLLRQAGFHVLWMRLGGHPVMPQRRFLGMPVFFEFLAQRV